MNTFLWLLSFSSSLSPSGFSWWWRRWWWWWWWRDFPKK